MKYSISIRILDKDKQQSSFLKEKMDLPYCRGVCLALLLKILMNEM